jgi:hypothetical protein
VPVVEAVQAGLVDAGRNQEKAILLYHQITLGALLHLVEATVAVAELLVFTVEV